MCFCFIFVSQIAVLSQQNMFFCCQLIKFSGSASSSADKEHVLHLNLTVVKVEQYLIVTFTNFREMKMMLTCWKFFVEFQLPLSQILGSQNFFEEFHLAVTRCRFNIAAAGASVASNS